MHKMTAADCGGTEEAVGQVQSEERCWETKKNARKKTCNGCIWIRWLSHRRVRRRAVDAHFRNADNLAALVDGILARLDPIRVSLERIPCLLARSQRVERNQISEVGHVRTEQRTGVEHGMNPAPREDLGLGSGKTFVDRAQL